jgi:hypothetical protein
MIVELLYTVQLSFREHVLVPEPFVLVALIAGVRRILVLAPELPKVLEKGDAQFQNAMIELAVLTIMTLSLVFCLVLLRKRHPDAVAERVWLPLGPGKRFPESVAFTTESWMS